MTLCLLAACAPAMIQEARRVSVTLVMLDWQRVAIGSRPSKHLMIGDLAHDSCGLLAYVNRDHYNANTVVRAQTQQ